MMLIGCRQSDIREMSVQLPDLNEALQPKIIEIVTHCNGVNTNSLCFDLAKRTLTLSYDSMKTAQSNIRYALDEAGVKVIFPEKTNDHAGH